MAYIRTNYPASLDSTNTSIDAKGRKFWRTDIVDFEDRTAITDPIAYIVLSNDVKALQEAVFSMQETFGVMPQSTSGTVSARIAALEDYTDLDARYGGPTWRSIAEGSRPTIMGHLHDGTATGASKIDLTQHVTGLLPKININADRTTGLTGGDLYVDSATDKKITTAIGEKYDKTGGSITGDCQITGRFNSNIYQEADAYAVKTSLGITVATPEAYSGTAVQAINNTTEAGTLITYIHTLRYGYYSLAVRMAVSAATSPLPIATIKVYSDNTLLVSEDIYPNRFTAENVYEEQFVAFNHHYAGTVNSKNIKINIDWLNNINSGATLSLDSLVITPLHVSVYDNILNA